MVNDLGIREVKLLCEKIAIPLMSQLSNNSGAYERSCASYKNLRFFIHEFL